MKRQVAGMSPDAINSAMNMMKNANPEDIKRQMKNQPMPSNTDEMKQHMNAFEQHTTSQNQYKYNASLKLKTEGNAFFSAGKHAEAREKYTLAKKNLSGLSSLEARKLHRTCMLNESVCCLGLEQWEDAAKLTSFIIINAQSDTKNPLSTQQGVKVFYRRARAFFMLGEKAQAYQDLLNAHNLDPNDEAVNRALAGAKGELDEEDREKPIESDVNKLETSGSAGKKKEEPKEEPKELTPEEQAAAEKRKKKNAKKRAAAKKKKEAAKASGGNNNSNNAFAALQNA